MREAKKSTSVSLTPSQKAKLRQLAAMLQATPNTIMGMLVDNAQVAKVERQEAIATLPIKKTASLRLGQNDAAESYPVTFPTEECNQEFSR